MPDRPAATTRRTALGGALAGLVVVVGCDVDDLDPRADPTPTGDTSGTTAPAQDEDADLVDEVRAELRELIGLVGLTRSSYPRLRVPLAALVELHTAHCHALGGEAVETSVPTTSDGPADALKQVRTHELRAQRRLADWSVRARSGALARLLASMSAAVAQQLSVLPTSLGVPE